MVAEERMKQLDTKLQELHSELSEAHEAVSQILQHNRNETDVL